MKANRSQTHQRSLVLPLLSWPATKAATDREDPSPAPAADTCSPERRWDHDKLAAIDPSLTSSQEWVHRAGRLKDEAGDLMSSRISPSSFQLVRQDRSRVNRLLEDHWQAVGMALKKLSAEVANLQASFAGKEKTELLAGNSMKNLEFQQAGLVQEFRNRVGRCDASIAVISSDIRSLAESLSAVNRQVASLSGAVEKGSKEVDQRVMKLQMDVQEHSKHWTETNSIAESKLEQNVTTLENKTENQLKEIQNNIQSLQAEYQTRQEQLQQELGQTLEELQKQTQHKQVTSKESGNDKEQLREATGEQIHELKGYLDRQLAKMEEKLMGAVGVEVEGIQSSMQSGFGDTWSSLEAMRRVLEGKQWLSEESTRKEVAKMKKLVILT